MQMTIACRAGLQRLNYGNNEKLRNIKPLAGIRGRPTAYPKPVARENVVGNRQLRTRELSRFIANGYQSMVAALGMGCPRRRFLLRLSVLEKRLSDLDSFPTHS